MTTRANFLTNADDLPEVHEITMAEYLAALSPTLATAELVPLDYADQPAEPVTHTNRTLIPSDGDSHGAGKR